MLQAFLINPNGNNTPATFILPKGSRKFNKRMDSPEIVNDDTIIPLYTDEGLATFKLYMEEAIIPKLKQDFPDNKFVQGLIKYYNDRTAIHRIASTYTLDGNMLPVDEAGDALLATYKADFAEMTRIRFSNQNSIFDSMADAFYIYTQYAYGGRRNQRSLMSLFDAVYPNIARKL